MECNCGLFSDKDSAQHGRPSRFRRTDADRRVSPRNHKFRSLRLIAATVCSPGEGRRRGGCGGSGGGGEGGGVTSAANFSIGFKQCSAQWVVAPIPASAQQSTSDMDAQEELADLQNRFQLLEGDRKAFYEQSQLTLKQNKEACDAVRIAQTVPHMLVSTRPYS
eukprot:1571265-Pleurochrysis_carterae.AAC.4